jgi:hypothetical protein
MSADQRRGHDRRTDPGEHTERRVLDERRVAEAASDEFF